MERFQKNVFNFKNLELDSEAVTVKSSDKFWNKLLSQMMETDERHSTFKYVDLD